VSAVIDRLPLTMVLIRPGGTPISRARTAVRSLYAEAGEWLAGEVWHDAGELCPLCLENRARLVMMYGHEINS
jgi:hypothetical protein